MARTAGPLAERPGYVVDASVASKWYLRDEEYVAPSIALLDDFREGLVYLTAPDLIRHEVGNAVLKATRREKREQRLHHEAGRQAIELFLAWGIQLERSDSLVPYAYALSGRLGCSFYDAVYLALAESTRTMFLYADDKLRRNIEGRFPFARWIEDYQPVADRESGERG